MRNEIDRQIHENKQIWKNTLRQFDKYKAEKSAKHKLAGLAELTARAAARIDEVPIVKVFHEPLLTVVEHVAKYGWKPLVLNMCTENYPKDALRSGAAGAEYDLLRRSNYFPTLSDSLYPIHADEFVWNDKITLFKSAEAKTYREPFTFAILSMIPIKNPQIISERGGKGNIDRYASITTAELMNRKIRILFDQAAQHNINCIILPDMGCADYYNPIAHIVDECNKCISAGQVQYIFFAIHTKMNVKHDSIFQYFHEHINRAVQINLTQVNPTVDFAKSTIVESTPTKTPPVKIGDNRELAKQEKIPEQPREAIEVSDYPSDQFAAFVINDVTGRVPIISPQMLMKMMIDINPDMENLSENSAEDFGGVASEDPVKIESVHNSDNEQEAEINFDE